MKPLYFLIIGHLCPILFSSELAMWVFFPREMHITPEYRVWLRAHITNGMAKWANGYFKDLTLLILLCSCFQTMSPVTRHSLLWLISLFFISKWQRLKCWLISFTSFAHHLALSSFHQTWTADIYSSVRKNTASTDTTEFASS